MQAVLLDEVRGREVSTQDRWSMKHFARKHVKWSIYYVVASYSVLLSKNDVLAWGNRALNISSIWGRFSIECNDGHYYIIIPISYLTLEVKLKPIAFPKSAQLSVVPQ